MTLKDKQFWRIRVGNFTDYNKAKEIEKLLLREALTASKGKRIEAAKILGLGRNTITRKIKDLDL